MSDKPQATVREVDGQLVLDDPQGLAVIGVIERLNLYRADPEAVRRLELRALQKTAETGTRFGVIVIDVDVPDHAGIVELLMPDQQAQWDGYRARGEKPMARGVVPRALLLELLELVRADARVGPEPLPLCFTAVFGVGGVTVFEVTV